MAAKPKFLARLCDRRLCTRGIFIDMADSCMDDDIEGRINLTAENEEARSALDQVADQALVLWDLLDALDTASATRLRPTLQIVLEEVGRIIASEMVMDLGDPDPEGGNLH